MSTSADTRIAAFGNSTGDKEMLQYTQGGSGARFELLVLHDDAARDFAYGPTHGLPSVPLVHFTTELDEYAKQDGWIVVSTKNDWSRIFAFENVTQVSVQEPEQARRKREVTGHLSS
jgi:hypothetical protein